MSGDHPSYCFIRLKGIGEVVMLLPLAEMIRQASPRARVSFLVETPCDEVLAGDSRIDHVYVVDRKNWRYRSPAIQLMRYRRLVSVLRRQVFEVVFDFQGSQASQVFSRLCKSRRRVGRPSGMCTDWLLDRLHAGEDSNRHNTDLLSDVLRSEGIEGRPGPLRLELRPEAGAWAEDWLRENHLSGRLVVGLNPGAGIREREWPAERYAAVGRYLVRERGAAVVVHGGADEEDLVRGIASIVGPNAIPLIQPRLDNLAALLARMAAFVSNDTGPMHIAAAVGCPLVGIFGNTSPYHSGPYVPKHFSIYLAKDCAPCGERKFGCDHMRCLYDITPAMVIERLEEALAASQEGRETLCHPSPPSSSPTTSPTA